MCGEFPDKTIENAGLERLEDVVDPESRTPSECEFFSDDHTEDRAPQPDDAREVIEDRKAEQAAERDAHAHVMAKAVPYA